MWLRYSKSFFFFFRVTPHASHVEVPRLRIESELHLPAYTTAIAMPDPSHIWNLHHSSGKAGFLTRWARPRIKPVSSWILVKFVTSWATGGTPSESYIVSSTKRQRGSRDSNSITCSVCVCMCLCVCVRMPAHAPGHHGAFIQIPIICRFQFQTRDIWGRWARLWQQIPSY